MITPKDEMKTIASHWTLMEKARLLGEARKRGDEEEIRKAQADFDAYRQICIEADEMCLHMTNAQLFGRT